MTRAIVPDKPRHYTSKAKNAQEAHEAIRPTDFHRDRAGSGDHGQLYSPDLQPRAGQPDGLGAARADDGRADRRRGPRDASRDRPGGALPRLSRALRGRPRREGRRRGRRRACRRSAAGDAPAKTGVEATQSFTQPPPRYSEASLVKRLEELGIGRPSTYAATLQTLKDREYVRLEKNRFIPEESGRLVTAFLERFFERYVNYDYTAELEEELDDVSGGRLGWQKLLEDFWKRLQAQGGRGDGAEAVRSDRGARRIPRRRACSPTRTTAATRGCARCAAPAGSGFAAASSARSSPAPIIRSANITRRFGQGGEEARDAKARPSSATASSSRAGASGPISSATASAPRSPRTCRRTG